MKTLKSKAPKESILPPQFRYRPAAQTDVRRTFRREQQRLMDAAYTQLLAAEIALRMSMQRRGE